jgi:hypothetical protein
MVASFVFSLSNSLMIYSLKIGLNQLANSKAISLCAKVQAQYFHFFENIQVAFVASFHLETDI